MGLNQERKYAGLTCKKLEKPHYRELIRLQSLPTKS